MAYGGDHSTTTIVLGLMIIVLHIVGMSTSHWTKYNQITDGSFGPVPYYAIHYGLFEYCSTINIRGVEQCRSYEPTRGIVVARILELCSGSLALLGVGATAMRLCIPILAENTIARLICTSCFALAGILGLVGVPVFCLEGRNCAKYWDFSLIITIVASCLYLMAVAPFAALTRYVILADAYIQKV